MCHIAQIAVTLQSCINKILVILLKYQSVEIFKCKNDFTFYTCCTLEHLFENTLGLAQHFYRWLIVTQPGLGSNQQRRQLSYWMLRNINIRNCAYLGIVLSIYK